MASPSRSTLRLLSRLRRLHPHLSPFPSSAASSAAAPIFTTSAGLRHLSTALRRPPSAPRKVDIGARARQIQNRRLWTYALTFGCVAGFVVIVLNTFQDQLVFYVTPTDALAKYAQNPSKNRFRLGGLVLEGSVSYPSSLSSSPEMEFVVTDLITDILVKYEGSLPDLFREGHSVVVEGFVKPFEEGSAAGAGKGSTEKAKSGECYFKATEVLAKHDEKYMPREVAEAIERNKAVIGADHPPMEASKGS